MKHIGIECEQIEGQVWGIGRIITHLLEELSQHAELKDKFVFHLFFKSKIPDYQWLKDPIFKCEVIKQPFSHKSFVLYYYVFLPIQLWLSGLDAMFYPNYMLPIIHPPWVPSLVLITEDIWHEMRSSQQQPHHRLAYWVFGYWAVWFADKLLAISKSSKHELIRLFGVVPERIEIAHLAADAPSFVLNCVGTTERQAPNKYGQYILFVAQAFPRRHLRETIQAFEKISPKFPDMKLIAVGPDKYKPQLNIKNNHIIRKERVSDDELTCLYTNAKAFIYVSDREAFGLPPLEALSYGVPSVLADKPISRELFGDNAFFVANPNSSDDIANTIIDALTNNTKHAAIHSTTPAILARFTWQHFTDSWLAIILGMIAK